MSDSNGLLAVRPCLTVMGYLLLGRLTVMGYLQLGRLTNGLLAVRPSDSNVTCS